jgi:hypothetical protein
MQAVAAQDWRAAGHAGGDFGTNLLMGGMAMQKPANAVGIFGGRLAKTADHAALAKAEEMAAQGVPREQIHADTGWFRGVDGKWRFEIDDSNAQLLASSSEMKEGTSRPLGSVYRHPDLFSAYPDMAETPFAVTQAYRPGEGAIAKLPDGRHAVVAGYEPGRVTKSDLGIVDVLPHENQHLIQSAEGFSPGGSYNLLQHEREALIREKMDWMRPVDDANGVPWRDTWDKAAAAVDSPSGRMDAYTRKAGEVEARTVQKRMDMTPDQRRARPPWLDYDVPENQQIVRFR